MKKLSLIFALLIISSSLVLAESIVDMGPFRKVTTEVSNDKTCFAEVDSMRNFQLFALATKSGDEEYARAKYVLSNYIHANRGEKIRARVQLSIPEGSYAGFARGRSFVWAMVRSSDGTGQPIGPIVVADSRLKLTRPLRQALKPLTLRQLHCQKVNMLLRFGSQPGHRGEVRLNMPLPALVVARVLVKEPRCAEYQLKLSKEKGLVNFIARPFFYSSGCLVRM